MITMKAIFLPALPSEIKTENNRLQKGWVPRC